MVGLIIKYHIKTEIYSLIIGNKFSTVMVMVMVIIMVLIVVLLGMT